MLIEAFLMLTVMRPAIRLFSFKRILNWFSLVPAVLPLGGAKTNDSATALQIGWAVVAAAARTPWQSACLVQALAAMIMLKKRRIEGCIYLGVAKDENVPDGIGAHAWLQCGESILTGASGYERFTVIAAYSWDKVS